MNNTIGNALNKFRGSQFTGPVAFAEFLSKEGINFSSADLGTWGQFLTAQFGRHSGMTHVPEWLAAVFGKLAEDLSPKTICDPWAGIGLVIAALHAAYPKESFAFTQDHSEYTLGKVLVPEANWQVGNALDLLDSTHKEFDIVASILPMNARSTRSLNFPPWAPTWNFEVSSATS